MPPFGGGHDWANWSHEPKWSKRHSEVLPFRACAWGRPQAHASTLALLTSLKTGPVESPSRLRRVAGAFRTRLIAWTYSSWEDETPWDFIGGANELCA